MNVERRLLDEVADALGSGDPAQAPERARRAVARIKALETELGKIRRADQEGEIASLASAASETAGSDAWWVGRLYEGRTASELREMALAVRGRLSGRAAAVVLGSTHDGTAQLVASCTNELLSRGLTPAAILEDAAKAIGGGAGGKGPVAIAGGRRAEGLGDALTAARARFEALLAP